MDQVIQIQNHDVLIKEFNDQRVVTLKDIDLVHERPTGTARKRFNDNKKHFILGEDYIVLNSDEAKFEFGIKSPNGLILITETGYLMLVKSFTDDLAWKVQRQLINCYFKIQEAFHGIIETSKVLRNDERIKIAEIISRTPQNRLQHVLNILEPMLPNDFQDSNENVLVKLTFNSNNLIAAINKNMMNQSQLAEATGIYKSSISQYCNGKTAPNRDRAKKIADVLNVSVNSFYK